MGLLGSSHRDEESGQRSGQRLQVSTANTQSRQTLHTDVVTETFTERTARRNENVMQGNQRERMRTTHISEGTTAGHSGGSGSRLLTRPPSDSALAMGKLYAPHHEVISTFWARQTKPDPLICMRRLCFSRVLCLGL